MEEEQFHGYDQGELLRKEYNRFLRNRPAMAVSLEQFIPPGIKDHIFPYRVFTVREDWDNPLPALFSPLLNTLVFECPSTHKPSVPTYDRFFNKVSEEIITIPKSSLPVITPINLKLPYDTEFPDGFKYGGVYPPDQGWVFTIPKEFLEEVLPYTIVLSRAKIKCYEYFKVSLTVNETLYLSVVQARPDATRFGGTSITPIFSQYSPLFSGVVQFLIEYWLTLGAIPDPSLFTLPTGEVLSFQHTIVEEYPHVAV